MCVYVNNTTNIYLSSASVIKQNTAFIILHYVQLILLVAKYIKTTPLRNVVDDSCFEVSSKLSIQDRDTTILSFFQTKSRGSIKPKHLFTSVKLFFFANLIRLWWGCTSISQILALDYCWKNVHIFEEANQTESSTRHNGQYCERCY